MTDEHYLLMCEQMGWEPNPEEIPPDLGSLSFETQQALILFNVLPDKIEGMSGSWLGKDFSGLSDIMDIYEIDDKKKVFELFLIIQRTYAEHYSNQQKMRSKAKR